MTQYRLFKVVPRVLTYLSILTVIVSCSSNLQPSGADEFERIPVGEQDHIAQITKLTPMLQDKRVVLPAQLGKTLRGVHPKSHGCVSAQFVVNKDIDSQYQVGIFAEPGRRYDAHIRFSNASVKLAPDLENRENGSRGMAVKVYDVEGEFFDKDSDKKNQDFLMINTPEFAIGTVRGYGFLTKALHGSADGTDANTLFGLGGMLIQSRVKASQSPFAEPTASEFETLKENLGDRFPEDFVLQDLRELIATLATVATKVRRETVRNPLQVQYFGAAPFLFGSDRVMKFSLAPIKPVEQQPFVDNVPSDNYLREAVNVTLQGNKEIIYDFKIQVRTKEADFGVDQQLIESANT
ncbi:MAG: catalase, partial [Pseudomonadales bacterium]|nr:catalase [Pseudomonadales bacterium]